MSDGTITFKTALDNKQLERQLNSVAKKIESIEDRIRQKQAERAALAQESAVLAARLDEAKARLAYMESGKEFFFRSQIKAQQAEVNQLQRQWDAVQARVERYDMAIQNATYELERNKEKAGVISQRLAQSKGFTLAMGKAINKANAYMTKYTNRLKNMLFRVAVFYTLGRALRSIFDWMGKVIKSNEQARKSIAQLKASLLTLAQPLVNVIVPTFIQFVNALSGFVTQLARVVSFLFGTTYSQSRKAAEALYEQTKAFEKTGDAAEKAGAQLAAFDELNVLSEDTSTDMTTIEPDFGAMDQFDAEEYKKRLDDITTYVSAALLALGVILVFTGSNIPLGLGLIALGAAGLAYSINENWDLIANTLQGQIGSIFSLTSAFLLVVGMVLAFSGVAIGLGIGLMIIGAAGLASVVAANWETISALLKGPLGDVFAEAGYYALVIGMVLAFSGVAIPLGIALMAVGAAMIASVVATDWEKVVGLIQGPIGEIMGIVGLALLAIGLILALSGVSVSLGIALILAGAASLATVVALNWEAIVEAIRGPVGEIMAIASLALLVLGLILVCSGAAIPLGIALIISGAAVLATVTALNWDKIVDAIRGPVGKIVAIASLALLVLGIILVCTGVALPLGVALIAAGAAGLVTVTALNWDAILNWIKNVWEKIKSWWRQYVAPIFTLDFWKNLFSVIGEGLWSAIKAGINWVIDGINWMIDQINKIKITIPDWVPGIGGNTYGFNIPKIPRLAAGAVIPPNREFLAVLGDQKRGYNIETPEGLLREIFREERTDPAMIALLREILEAIRAGGNVYLDGEVIYRNQQKVARRVGKNLIAGGAL